MSTTTMAPALSVTVRRDHLAGTATLIRFILRRDRVRIPVWLVVLGLVSVGTLGSFLGTYPDPAARANIAQTLHSPMGLAMTGPARYLENYHYGSILSHQMLGFTVLAVGMMSVLLVVRHTRAEEETGRAELVRATVVGRHANLAATLIVVAAVNVVLGLLIAATLAGSAAEGITGSGALLYGAAHTAAGLVFAAVAAVTAQITGYSRGATGMGLAVVGLAYVVRAIGDAGENALSWLSPIGWAQHTWPFLDDQWWPLLLSLALAAALTWLAVTLSSHRDVGTGLRQTRAGAARASNLLATPFGFALRLHRGLLAGFGVAVAALAAMYGSLLGDVEAMLGDVDVITDALAERGGALVEALVSMVMLVNAVVVTVYAVLAATRVRSEETAGRAEPVLATPLHRSRWVLSHLAVVLLGSTLMLVVAGLVLGGLGASTVDDGAFFGKAIGAALAYLPAVWCTIGVAVALFGLRPQWIGWTWLVPVWTFVAGYLGELIGFPDWLARLSPFGWVPELPVADFALTPLVVLTALAAALVALGLAALGRRSINTG
ncbi:ABC transporter permease [Prauserella oleivorans]|uniref:ABC transporter permease n=1 Tax=Prauserella oleivorans TaxID=1478153 RepID=A0ABW5WCE3_9PSEU